MLNWPEFILTSEPKIPPIGSSSIYKYYSETLKDISGSSNQNINGSIVPQLFFLKAYTNCDVRITDMIITIASNSLSHHNFGGLKQLSVGWNLTLSEDNEVNYIIKNAKTCADICTQVCIGNHLGENNELHLAKKFINNIDAYIYHLNIKSFIPTGIRLGMNSNSMIVSTIQDDLRTLTKFSVQCLGYRHYS